MSAKEIISIPMPTIPSPLSITKYKDFDPQDHDHILYGFDRPPQLPCRLKRARSIESYDYYVAVSYDANTGKFNEKISESFFQDKDDIQKLIIPKFKALLKGIPQRNSSGKTTKRMSKDVIQSDSDQFASYKHRQSKPLVNDSHHPSKRIRTASGPHVRKQHRRIPFNNYENLPPQTPEKEKFVEYPVNATKEWEGWMSDAFRSVQQVTCRVIAKEWIKTIHPRKQSTHPYNGKLVGAKDEGDSERTKPPYWPPDVIHKEPDHINKDQRTKLLVHLLMHTPYCELSPSGELIREKVITAQTLKESLDNKGDDFKGHKWEIIENIIHLRTRLEQYNEGGFNRSAKISARDYSEAARASGTKSDKSSDRLKTAHNHRRGSDIEIVGSIDSANTEPQQISHPTPSTPPQEPTPSQTDIEHQASTRNEPPLKFSVYQYHPNIGHVSRSSPQEIQRDRNERLAEEKSLSADEISYKHSQEVHQSQISPQHTRHLFQPRAFGVEHFNMQAFAHWPTQDLDISNHYTHNTVTSHPQMNVVNDDAVYNQMYTAPVTQHGYYDSSAYTYDQDIQGQQSPQQRSSSPQYDNYNSQASQSQGITHQSYYGL